MSRLNGKQREALCILAGERHRRHPPGGWYSVENGVDGRTGKALVNRGLAEEKRERFRDQRPAYGLDEHQRVNTYPVFRITDAGREAWERIKRWEETVREGET